jgi:hypothetical protein
MQSIGDHVSQVTEQLREKIVRGNRPPRPPKKAAEILPFPSTKQCVLCDDELVNVMNLDKDARDRWLIAVVRRHKRRLKKLGIAADQIEHDVRALQVAFGLVSDDAA